MNEEALHKVIAQYLTLALPADVYWFHPANGEKRGKRAAAKLKAMGVKAGTPDLCIIHRGRAFFIELKRPAGFYSGRTRTAATPTEVQALCHEQLKNAGSCVAICRSLEDVQEALWGWGIVEKRAA